MRTAMEYYGHMPEEINSVLLDEIQSWLTNLPNRTHDDPEKQLWSCHGITRAAKELFELSEWTVTDGFFAKQGVCHSWLFREHKPVPVVLDLSPMGGSRLFIVSMHLALPWRDFYIPNNDYYRDMVESFEDEACEIVSTTNKAKWDLFHSRLIGASYA